MAPYRVCARLARPPRAPKRERAGESGLDTQRHRLHRRPQAKQAMHHPSCRPRTRLEGRAQAGQRQAEQGGLHCLQPKTKRRDAPACCLFGGWSTVNGRVPCIGQRKESEPHTGPCCVVACMVKPVEVSSSIPKALVGPFPSHRLHQSIDQDSNNCLGSTLAPARRLCLLNAKGIYLLGRNGLRQKRRAWLVWGGGMKGGAWRAKPHRLLPTISQPSSLRRVPCV